MNHGFLSFCRKLANSIQSRCEFNLNANSISMQLRFCRFIIYIVCLYSSATSLSAHCRWKQPPLPLMGNFDKDRLSHLLCYWSSIHVEAFITLRNFNCCKINRGSCPILKSGTSTFHTGARAYRSLQSRWQLNFVELSSKHLLQYTSVTKSY